MKTIVLGFLIILSFSSFAVDVNGYPVNEANEVWATRSTSDFPAHWNAAPYEIHEKYGLSSFSWKGWPTWEPIVSGEWVIRRNIRLDSAREDLRDTLRFDAKNMPKMAQINYNSYLENLYKADYFHQKIINPISID